jgi:signal peptide peptidase SppA
MSQQLQQRDFEIELSEGLMTSGINHFEQFFGPWAMIGDRFLRQLEGLSSINVNAHVEKELDRSSALVGSRSEAAGDFDRIDGNIAVVEIRGTMTKFGASFARGGATVFARRRIRQARQDETVKGALLVIDSPGGTVSGTKDLADDVHALAQEKPVLTYFEDTGASAAFYVGSQGTVVKSNESAVIGSIGTVLVLNDYSKQANALGIKVHVISTGDMKGAGAPGSEITKEQLAYFQALIDEGNEIFLRDAARGTGMSLENIRKVADGRVFMASTAVKHGLIDGIATLDDAVNELREMISSSPTRRSRSMETNAEPKPATIAELKEACPGASADFILEQSEAKATLSVAQTAFAKLQAKQIEERDKKIAEQEATEAKRAEQLPGNDPVNADQEGEAGQQSWGSDPQAFFSQEIDVLMDKNIGLPAAKQLTRREAAVAVHEQNPGLEEAILKHHIPKPGRVSE